MKRLRPRKQLLLTLVVFLLLGAIVNVAVAWGIQFIPQSLHRESFLALDYYEKGEALGASYKGVGIERVHCASAPFTPSAQGTISSTGVTI